MKKSLALAGIILMGLGVGWLIMGVDKGDLINPLGRKFGIIKRETEMEVVGFLPTWMIGKTGGYCEELTQMVFLGVEVEEDGDLKWDLQAKKLGSDEYKSLKTRFGRCGGKNILGIKLFEDKKLKSLFALGEDEVREGQSESIVNLIGQVKEAVRDYGLDGVNVDFEYMANPTAVLEEEFVSFIDELKKAEVGEVGVDVFANTIIKGKEEGLQRLLAAADRVIVMAYDFHASGSQYAGAVAPINSPAGERNITEVVRRIVDLNLNKEKIVMAYPLYGYEWITVDENLGSRAEDYVGMWSIKRIKESEGKIQKYSSFKENWDEVSMTPWMSWTERVKKSKVESYRVGKKWKKRTVYYTENETHQVYFENEKSLKIKMELAKQTGVAGVGFWALGYEPDNFFEKIL